MWLMVLMWRYVLACLLTANWVGLTRVAVRGGCRAERATGYRSPVLHASPGDRRAGANHAITAAR